MAWCLVKSTGATLPLPYFTQPPVQRLLRLKWLEREVDHSSSDVMVRQWDKFTFL
jgi:hypothetical protein